MKTWQRILIVVFLLAVGITIGLSTLKNPAREKALDARSVSNLKMIGIALQMYGDDWNDTFPNLSNPDSMRAAITNNLPKSTNPFFDPRTGQPYQPNSSLTYQKRKDPNASVSMVTVYEPDPTADGSRRVLFADAHVERVSESRWQELKKTSNIP
ncbi:MAG TPA: hypothetical protein VNL17_12895 [Verrucomicrobiae bacterium]|nr:hypothetical protein [Verrucomicrobiae bacterium]